MKGTVVIDTERCKGCGYCVLFCPFELIQVSETLNSQSYLPAKLVDPSEKCTGCAVCYDVCPDVAIEVFKKRKEVAS